MIKGSAIVAIVTVFDLMGETRRAFSRTFDYQMYVWAAILYLIMVETSAQSLGLAGRPDHPAPEALSQIEHLAALARTCC